MTKETGVRQTPKAKIARSVAGLSTLDDLLRDQRKLEESEAKAIEEVQAWQVVRATDK